MLPKYFIIKQDQNNLLWEEFREWFNRNYGDDWDDIWEYWGVDSNGSNVHDHLDLFKIDVEEISLEQWNEAVNNIVYSPEIY